MKISVLCMKAMIYWRRKGCVYWRIRIYQQSTTVKTSNGCTKIPLAMTQNCRQFFAVYYFLVLMSLYSDVARRHDTHQTGISFTVSRPATSKRGHSFIHTFLPARRYASAGYRDRNVSVCPSVCASVRHAPVLWQNEEC